MAKSKSKAEPKAAITATGRDEKTSSIKVITREEVADLDGEAKEVSDPYARKPKTETRNVDGRAKVKTRI